MKRAVIFLINLYRRFISPLKKPCCRFYPTCSAYSVEAIQRYGVLRGGAMSVWRICRCNPFCKGGYDPVKPLSRVPKGSSILADTENY